MPLNVGGVVEVLCALGLPNEIVFGEAKEVHRGFDKRLFELARKWWPEIAIRSLRSLRLR
jgi:hypothetical protein